MHASAHPGITLASPRPHLGPAREPLVSPPPRLVSASPRSPFGLALVSPRHRLGLSSALLGHDLDIRSSCLASASLRLASPRLDKPRPRICLASDTTPNASAMPRTRFGLASASPTPRLLPVWHRLVLSSASPRCRNAKPRLASVTPRPRLVSPRFATTRPASPRIPKALHRPCLGLASASPRPHLGLASASPQTLLGLASAPPRLVMPRPLLGLASASPRLRLGIPRPHLRQALPRVGLASALTRFCHGLASASPRITSTSSRPRLSTDTPRLASVSPRP